MRVGSRRRPHVALAVVLLLVVVAVVVRLITLRPPDLRVRVAVTSTIRLPGSAPKPAWPASGQAAFVVQGLGSLGSSGGAAPRPTASLAKVMTAYLTLTKYPLSGSGGGFTLTVTRAEATAEREDARDGESVVAVRPGERLDERQLLEGLLVRSGDNIARMLATYEAGSIPAFVAEMNRAARAVGMRATTYTDPSGLDPATVSTAGDQLRVLERAIRFRAFRQIASMPAVTLPVGGTLGNYDPLIAEGYFGKTGSDSAAEGCLAFFKAVTVHGRRLTLVGVVLGQGEGSDTSVLLGAAAAAAQHIVASVAPAIAPRPVLRAHAVAIVATNADGRRVSGVTARPLRVIGWGGLHERLAVHPRRPGTELRSGQRLGDAALVGSLPTPAGEPTDTEVRASAALPEPGILWRLAHLL